MQACTFQGIRYSKQSSQAVHVTYANLTESVRLSQVQELQHSSMQASSSIPLQSNSTTHHATPSPLHPDDDESALYNARISDLTIEIEQLKADKQALLTGLSSTEQRPLVDTEGQLVKLDTEIGQLKTEKQLLSGRLGTAERLLAEARSAIDQKEGHLQGLQVSVVKSACFPCRLLYKKQKTKKRKEKSMLSCTQRQPGGLLFENNGTKL